jgi:hypothetical protein
VAAKQSRGLPGAGDSPSPRIRSHQPITLEGVVSPLTPPSALPMRANLVLHE